MDQPASFSFFYESGPPESRQYYSYTLNGAFSANSLSCLYEETRGEQKSAWSATLEGRDYEDCLALIRDTSLQTGTRDVGGYRLTLVAADGESLTGQPLNAAQWVEMLSRIERIGPGAAKRKQMLFWGLGGGIYIGFQLLLILIWLLLYISDLGGPLVHLLLVLALVLAFVGAIAGTILWLRSVRKR
ncbi:MAG TPA: hypothetical protein VGB17_01360 [Pyrinomonadaceae bacterium]|jgi:hypothetical protein